MREVQSPYRPQYIVLYADIYVTLSTHGSNEGGGVSLRSRGGCWNLGGNGPGLLVVRSESQLLAVRHSSARCRSSKVLNGSATYVIICTQPTDVWGEAMDADRLWGRRPATAGTPVVAYSTGKISTIRRPSRSPPGSLRFVQGRLQIRHVSGKQIARLPYLVAHDRKAEASEFGRKASLRKGRVLETQPLGTASVPLERGRAQARRSVLHLGRSPAAAD